MLLGATGLVGAHVLDQARADPRIGRIVAPTRRPLAAPAAPGLLNPQVDFSALPAEADWWQVDAVICALGTTRRSAGSREAFRALDVDAVVRALSLAHRHGATTAAVVSAVGADAGSRVFYLRCKGQMERAVAGIGFASLTLLRPAALGGGREEERRGERLAGTALRLLGPLVPRRYRTVPAERVAEALRISAIGAHPGIHVVESELL